ncbi:hypothetical protein PybrP1_010382 [[Pythium] brassicae (nom. inval.)]|nr:hypothetical protein PybrP1_010382 [[Pythium] brassicae (nom. inval.)]
MGGRARFGSSSRGGGRGGGGRHSRQSRHNGDSAPAATANFRSPGYMDGSAKSVDERVVGIRQFLAPAVPGFHGTVKERYSDFLVREVARSGEVARLTDVKRFTSARAKGRELKVSEVFKQRVLAFLNDAAKRDESPGKMRIAPPVHALVGNIAGRLLGLFNRHKRAQVEKRERANIAALTTSIAAICGEATAQALEQFLLRILDEQAAAAQTLRVDRKPGAAPQQQPLSEPEPAPFFFPEIDAKESRTAVHASIREFADSLVVSDTVPGANGGAGLIRVRRATVGGKKRKDVDQRGKNAWPPGRPDHLQFVLYKRNLETNSVMGQLAKAMGVSVAAFGYAGTKDKRGVTTQFCTIYRGSLERLEMLNRAGRGLESFNFLVGDAKYVRDKLNLGDLQGNQFSLAIRGLPPADAVPDAQIHAAVASWTARGFVNYFGLQRFGTKSVPTHEVGRAILQRDYARVVDLVLQPQEGDATKIAEARARFQADQDVEAALRALPPYLIAERALLQGLKTYGLGAHAQAIQCIPRHLRMMYTHSYQSFVWNMVASDRVSQFASDAPVVGDLVIPHDAVAAALLDEFVAVDETDATAAVPLDGDDGDAGSERAPKRPKVGASIAAPVLVTAENIAQFSVYDVVLPLPGYDIAYPENGLRARYEEILAADGVDFESLQRATNSEYHLPGSFRHLLKKPLAVSHEIKLYEDPTVPLLETDVDRLEGRAVQASIPGAKLRALCLDFQLNSSSYATMAVRELLKQSSNLGAQPKATGDAESK